MQVPLLADVLAFKTTDDVAHTFEAHGPSSVRARAIDWKWNRFLMPAVILSLVAALVGSIVINVQLIGHGKTYMKSIVERSNLKKRVKALKDICKVDSDNEEDEEDCSDSDDDDDDKAPTDVEQREIDRNKEYSESVQCVDATPSLGMRSSLFNAEIPHYLTKMIQLTEKDMEQFFEADSKRTPTPREVAAAAAAAAAAVKAAAEKRSSFSSLRSFFATGKNSPKTYREGDRIKHCEEVNWKDIKEEERTGNFYNGEIASVNSDGTYDIVFDGKIYLFPVVLVASSELHFSLFIPWRILVMFRWSQERSCGGSADCGLEYRVLPAVL